MSKKQKKKKRSRIYVGTHVKICNTNPHNFNDWRGIVRSIRGPKSVKYGVDLLWDPSGSSTNTYQGFSGRNLKIISIRGKKKKR